MCVYWATQILAAFLNVCVQSLSCLRLFSSPWSLPGSLSMEFPRQQHGGGYHFLLQGNLPDSGIEPSSPASARRFFAASHLSISRIFPNNPQELLRKLRHKVNGPKTLSYRASKELKQMLSLLPVVFSQDPVERLVRRLWIKLLKVISNNSSTCANFLSDFKN